MSHYQEVERGLATSVRMPTIRERILQRKESAERDLMQCDALLKMLDETPAFEKIHDAVSKLNIGLY